MRPLLVALVCLLPAAAAAAQADDVGDRIVLGILVTALLLTVYFLPWIVANHRGHHRQVAIFFINLLLGWSMIGWLGALVWALTKPGESVTEFRWTTTNPDF
jgi:hypothetical protein